MGAGQLIALVMFVLVIAGLVFAFVRHGSKIKPDPENKPPSEGTFGGGA
jgi:hypothetical protein